MTVVSVIAVVSILLVKTVLTVNTLVDDAANNPALLTVGFVAATAAATFVRVSCVVMSCFLCVGILLLEVFVKEDLNDAVDVTLMFVIAIVSIMLVKTVLTLGERIVVCANNLPLLTVVVVVATLASDVGVDCVVISVSFNAMLMAISRVVARINSFLIVVSLCVETGLFSVPVTSGDFGVSTRRLSKKRSTSK